MEKQIRLIEKDKLLSEILNIFYKWLIDEKYFNVCLSGGTSLSKVYQLIERLSEDIDLIIFVTKNNSKSLCKEIKKNIDLFFKNNFLAEADSVKNSFCEKGFYSKMKFTWKKHSFKIDVIVRKFIDKADNIEIKPVFNVSDHKKIGKFPVVSLCNILNNKLLAFHNKYGLAELKLTEKHRIVRHIYDIHCLVNKLNKDEIFQMLNFYQSYLALDKNKIHNELKENILFNDSLVDPKKIAKEINTFLINELINNNLNKKYTSQDVSQWIDEIRRMF